MNKKFGIGILLVLITLAIGTVASASSFGYADGFRYYIWSRTDKTCYVEECDETKSRLSVLEIPETLDGYTVIGIGASFLWENAYVEEVIFPPTLESVGEGAFRGSTALRTITFTGTHLDLSRGAFKECAKLEYVYGMENVTVFKWKSEIFRNCPSLKHIVIPKSLSYYDEDSAWFNGCTSLTIELQNGMSSICDNFLTGSTGIKEIIIPSSVTKIGANCMRNMSGTTIRTKGYISSVGTNSLLKCKKVYVRSGTALYNYCRNNGISYSKISSKPLVFPETIKAVSEEAFIGLTVEEIDLGDGVEIIGARAFANCKNLVFLDLPDNVQIGENAFEGCPNLTLICTRDSAGYLYARENGIPYILK